MRPAAMVEVVERAYRAVAAGDFAAAEQAFLRAHEMAPHDALIAGDVAAAAMRTGGYAAAAPWLAKAADLAPGNAGAQATAGLVMAKLGRNDQAIVFLERCIALDPGHREALEALGAIAVAAGDAAGGLARYEAAIRVAPTSANLIGAGNALSLMSRHREASARFEQATEREPGNTQAVSARLMAAIYDPELSPMDVADLHRRLSAVYERLDARKPVPRPRAGQRIRIGYVAADFRRHVGASQLISLVRHHDRTTFEVACYVANSKVDSVTEQFRSLVDIWRPIYDLDAAAAADLVVKDGIDILIDFDGHGEGGRLDLFALHPAPITVSLPGYVATTGLRAIDYRTTDRISDPDESAQAVYSERLVWLPEGHFSYEPLFELPPVGQPPATTLGRLTFGSFHNRRKYHSSLIRTWAEILKRVPESRLVLKDRQFGYSSACEQVRLEFTRFGVDPLRIEFLGYVPTHDAHYRAYEMVDIALDPFPFNGTTTTIDATLMGVPVVALRGDRHVSRLAANILTHIDAEELIAETPERYVDLAVALAADDARRARYRTGLRDAVMASPMLQPRRVVGPLEDFYRSVVK